MGISQHYGIEGFKGDVLNWAAMIAERRQSLSSSGFDLFSGLGGLPTRAFSSQDPMPGCYTQRKFSEVLSNQPEIRLYLLFPD